MTLPGPSEAHLLMWACVLPGGKKAGSFSPQKCLLGVKRKGEESHAAGCVGHISMKAFPTNEHFPPSSLFQVREVKESSPSRVYQPLLPERGH